MSTFHTKTIERILSPVALQVSKLILLFEDAPDETVIPNLEIRVQVVKQAVDNLIKVGHDTIAASSDELFRREMPPSLLRVEEASVHLEEAVFLLQKDANSVGAKQKLIEGSRGILQGTSSVLLTFDMSEVRKIISHCRTVLNVISSSNNVDSLGKLADFVKALTPCMARMIQEVDSRQDELTIQSHSALLRRGIEQLKRLTPMLISSLKLNINTVQNALPGVAECRANRDFLICEMSDEIHEIIRGLQLTESDASEMFDDDLASLHVTKATFDSRLQFAGDWLSNPGSILGSTGEKALQQVINSARRLVEITGSESQRKLVEDLCADLETIGQTLNENRRLGHASELQLAQLRSAGAAKLSQLSDVCSELLTQGDRHNPVFRLARTLQGKLVQAQRWLHDPRGPLRQVGLEACRSLVHGTRKLIDTTTPNTLINGDSVTDVSRDACCEACDHVDRASDRLYTITSQPESTELSTTQHDLAIAISRSLEHIWHTLQQHLVNRVAHTYTDLVGPLRQLTEAACPSSGGLPNELVFNEKMNAFLSQCDQLCSTAELAATATLSDVWRADALRCLANQLPELGAQVVMAGRAALLASLPVSPGESSSTKLSHQQATADHFALMRQHWTDSADRMRALVDEAVDANAFIVAQEASMLKDSERTEESIQKAFTTGVVDSTTSIARRANRVLQVATREADNSDDTEYVSRMNDCTNQLRATITPMVSEAKGLVTQIRDPQVQERWRRSNRDLFHAVGRVKHIVPSSTLSMPYYHLRYPQLSTCDSSSSKGTYSEPLVQEMKDLTVRTSPIPSRTEGSDTELEEEFDFPPPDDSQPIMVAAHALHREARLWSSRDNELIATTKRMAALMAKLSQIVRGEWGSKKDLINVSMAIVTASLEASSSAKTLAKECTDRRIRSNLLNLSDRILTIANQLKILSTVKATMLESHDNPCDISTQSEAQCGSNEDQENTESLVGNAQNLMQTVIEALHVAGSASIKMRVDSGYKIIWRPRFVTARQTAVR